MVSSGLGGLLGSKSVEQFFIWSVITEIVARALAPFLATTEQLANEALQTTPLTPADLVDMVLRGHLVESEGAAQARRSGVNAGDFHLMVENVGNPPGPQELAEALRRQIISEGAPGQAGVTFYGGIAEGRIRNEWADVIRQLDARWPTYELAITAAVRNMIQGESPQEVFKRLGGDPVWYQLLFDVAGEGPSPVEAGILANRKIIPWDGTGPQATSFAQAVAESRFKDKWTPAYRALAEYRPPPRTVVAMWREGSLNTEQATQNLLDYGVRPELIPSYLTQSKKGTVATAHAATESEILRLYEEQAISRDEAAAMLKSHGFVEQDIPIVLDYADLQTRIRRENVTITSIHRLYAHGKIDFNSAKSLLADAQVPESRADYLLTLWELERTSGTRDLTVKDIADAVSLGILSKEEGLNHLIGVGYNPDDAALIAAINWNLPAQQGG